MVHPFASHHNFLPDRMREITRRWCKGGGRLLHKPTDIGNVACHFSIIQQAVDRPADKLILSMRCRPLPGRPDIVEVGSDFMERCYLPTAFYIGIPPC